MIRSTISVFAWLLLFQSLVLAEERLPWTTSRVTGTDEPARPYVSEPLWPGITFSKGLDIAYSPDLGKIIIAEQKGKIWALPADTTADPDSAELVADLNEIVKPQLESVLGMTIHPDFAENGEIFVFYRTSVRKPDSSRISRFRLCQIDQQLLIEPGSEEIIITFGGGGHNGGHLGFGPDGMLYFLVGDLEVPSPPDPQNTGQDLSDLAGSVMRIDVENITKEHPYRVPEDNPFVDVSGARPEIWAYGLRNPWKLCFHPKTNDLWVGDVGWELWEMLYKIERGANYGWSIVEGPQPIKPLQNPGPQPVITPPIKAHSHQEMASITGGYVFDSERLPDLRGAYVYSDFVTGRTYGLWHDGETEQRHEFIADTRLKVVSFGQAAAGEIVFLNWDDGPQTLHRLVRNPKAKVPTDFPQKLSETGIFTDVTAQEPSPGVYDFEINAPIWQDGAEADYWVCMPDNGGFRTQVQDRRNAPLLRFRKPKDTVLAKTISIGETRVETQILHFDGYWNGYTYRWNEAQTEADLVPVEGLDAEVAGQPWRFHSRAECTRCHGGNFNRLLAFTPGQIDIADQLERFRSLNLVDDAFVDFAETEPLTNPHDDTADLNVRARSWLHANCAHCHRVSGGGSVPMQMQAASPLDLMDLVDVTPTKGGFDLEDPKLIVPGNPYRSVLYYRSATSGLGHMPMLGAKTIDESGVRVIRDWIASLGPKPPRTPISSPDTVTNALILHGWILDENTSPTERARILKEAAASENPAITGLFERFQED
ncbi:MAG: glucose/arabinose dehydrogenase/mono/diheme cytochrome c family protein [Verrucomicrobiales bacterium]|jgi:glucose/arabinose dehydrogenase/mono/diheme cytochrome c family protein